MANKLDNLFQKIISDRAFNFGQSEINQVKTVEAGRKCSNNEIRAIAEILFAINSNLEKQRENLRIRNKQDEEPTIDDAELKALYRKILPLIS